MALALFFSNLDRISEFSWFGGKAKTREIVHEARATIDQLRNMAVVLADAAITGIVASGRWNGMRLEVQEKIRKDMIKLLHELDVSENDIKKSQRHFILYGNFDHVSKIIDHSKIEGLESNSKFADQWKELQSKSKFGNEMPTPDELEKFFMDFDILDSDTKERIEDYRYFIKHGEYRDYIRFMKI